MDGIALYFHVFFTKSHTPLGFSTDPWSPRTNWLQTVLFFDQSLSVNDGSLYYGGIEFLSPTKASFLNDIVVNFEMLMGDPTHADIEVEMSWHFKLTTAAAADPDEILPENKNSNNCNVSKTKSDQKNIIKNEPETRSENSKVPNSDKSQPNCALDQKSIKCSGFVVTTDNLNTTITIGKNIYTCRKVKRNKSKYPKKG